MCTAAKHNALICGLEKSLVSITVKKISQGRGKQNGQRFLEKIESLARFITDS
jgi:hypothetical protein